MMPLGATVELLEKGKMGHIQQQMQPSIMCPEINTPTGFFPPYTHKNTSLSAF